MSDFQKMRRRAESFLRRSPAGIRCPELADIAKDLLEALDEIERLQEERDYLQDCLQDIRDEGPPSEAADEILTAFLGFREEDVDGR